MFDFLLSMYVRYIFLRGNISELKDGDTLKIYFSRGTFRHDVDYFIGCDETSKSIVLDSQVFRRLLRYIIPDLFLEQIICLEYREYIRNKSRKTISFIVNKINSISNGCNIEIIFGGVDYFEVAMLCDSSLYNENVKIIAYFHENYTIGYVDHVSRNIYQDIKNPFIFDELYVYGDPAYKILKEFTKEELGPRCIPMPRLVELKSKLSKVSGVIKNSKVNVLFLAFPGAEYLAPLCFSTILLSLCGLSSNVDVIVKFKNMRQVKSYRRRLSSLSSKLKMVGAGTVGDYLSDNDIVIVFNSLSFYESLLSNSIIIIPCFSDSNHDENLLQESQKTINEVYDFKTIVYVYSTEELQRYISVFEKNGIQELLEIERNARMELLSRKFYI